MFYYNKSPEESLHELNTNIEGLSDAEVDRRRTLYGLNELQQKKKISALKILLAQFNSPLVWILIAATVISFALGETTEGYVILTILILNALFGFIQEFKAEKAIDALKKMSALQAKVIRQGQIKAINTKFLVPGDIIVLETGDKVPADGRIIESSNLEIQEATLTGESVPVEKSNKILNGELALGDRKNVVYSSTIVTKGRCKVVVTHIGKDSEIGKIAKLIEDAEEGITPLQKQLKDLAKWLGIIVLIIATVIFATGVIRSGFATENIINMFIFAVALAVAAIPEGLPAVVTISLAIGVKKMVKRNALVRKLSSVETLGACNVICSDKTGTLTHNEMTVRKIYANTEVTEVSGAGYAPMGEFSNDPKKLHHLLMAGMLCNDSKLVKKGEEFNIMGDPTEGCLVVSAMKAGFSRTHLTEHYPRVDEVPFSSERKMMTTIHKHATSKVAFSKGAPDVLLNQCDRILINNTVRHLTPDMKKHLLEVNEHFASEALRVLGFAYKILKGKNVENNMIFLGLQGMIDPPREEVKNAIHECKNAGIKVVMITGDHKTTALAIAHELGIEGNSLTGEEIEKLADLTDVIDETNIYARVDPKHKSRLVDALQHKGYFIAMTGDGVNDAPALKEADTGISMGITGTDVAKEASDMILTDDNFASIVNAVKEGRTIFSNIKKFVSYLLSSNVGEVFTVFGAMLMGLALPITAIQILWINLITDGLPALALGVEKAEPNIMERPPRDSKEKIVTKSEAKFVFLVGIIMMVGTIFLFVKYLPKGYAYASTMAFCTLMLFQMFNVFNNRSEKVSIFKLKFFGNKFLLLAVSISILLQLGVVYLPILSNIFGTVPLTLKDWGLALLTSVTVLIGGEIFKVFKK